MQIIPKYFANNELRLTVQSEPYQRKTSGYVHLSKKARLEKELEAVNRLSHLLGTPKLVKWREALLTSIANLKKHHIPGTPNPKRNFTRNGAHRILEAGAVMDDLYPGKTWMVTLTIPGSTVAALKTVAAYSHEIVNKLSNTIRDNPKAKGAMYFYVWEFQTRSALHMHWAVVHPDVEIAEQIAKKLEKHWFQLLLKLKRKTGVDCFEKEGGGTWRNKPHKWRSDVQKVKKSVAAYYAKYCSKDSTNQVLLKKYKSDCIYYPRHWWNSSYNVKAEVKKRRFQHKEEGLTQEQCDFIVRNLWEIFKDLGLEEPQPKIFPAPGRPVRFLFCTGTVQIAFGNPETWKENCERIKSLFVPEVGEQGTWFESIVKEAKKLFPTPTPQPPRAPARGVPFLHAV